ncbi:MAG TPA: protein meaA, partial [Stellaceae bacterium]|nr:protein meaA [Stellaceae bacterium]
VCSYHLQEAGATPVQEVAYALATAEAVLDAVRATGQVPDADLPQVVGRLSFFVNAGVRFITEICKLRAFAELWDEITRDRYGVAEEKFRRFRYGVQVNSLGLTEQQPENNVYRILIEMLAVVLSKSARARAVQLPAWNEALGLPRPWDQQWSLRLQQIVAYETDLLEYGDIFDGAPEIERKVKSLRDEIGAELERVRRLGGAVAAVESGYMKQRLVESNARRLAAIERGEQIVVGVNRFTESAPSPLLASDEAGFLVPDAAAESEQVHRLAAFRAARDSKAVATALAELKRAASEGRNIMPPSIDCARAGVTTGEWAESLRQVFGEYRAPTGLAQAAPARAASGDLAGLRARVTEVSDRLGRRLKILVGKPGLDGHSNGAEQVALKARDAGFEVVYEGIRLTPAQIVNAALEEGVHVVGLSILSGSHVQLITEILAGLRAQGLDHVPVVVGGIIPPEDEAMLKRAGVARVYTPKDYDLTAIIRDIVEVVAAEPKLAA